MSYILYNIIMTSKIKNSGRPKTYNYTGTKKVTSIRLTDEEKKNILKKYSSIQEFVQKYYHKEFKNNLKSIVIFLTLFFLTSCGQEKQPWETYIQAQTQELSFNGKVDFLRQFIYYNSEQNDSTFELPKQMDTALNTLLIAKNTNNSELVKWRCFNKSRAMIYMLEKIGIKARSIGIWTDSGSDGDFGHALLEVFNPNTNKWEITDPTYNVFFQDSDGTRLSMFEIVSGDLSDLEPCNESECSWDIKAEDPDPIMQVDHFLWNGMFDAVVYNFEKEVFINTDRHDLNFVYPDINVTLSEYYLNIGYEINHIE